MLFLNVIKTRPKLTGMSLRFKLPGKYNKSRWGIKQLEISFGFIFLLFSYESSQGPRSWYLREIPSPGILMTTLMKLDDAYS